MSSSICEKSKGRLLNLCDLHDYNPPPAKHLIHSGILNIGSRMVIFGDEGSFKTAIASHAGMCLTRGSNWLTFGTSSCNVLYIQGEMSIAETKERLEQYIEGSRSIYKARPGTVPNLDERTEAYAMPKNFVVETLTQDFTLDTTNGYNFLKNEIELMITEFPAKPIVLIIDPLFKMFRYELVKEEDIKVLLDNIDRMRLDRELFKSHPGMAVIIVHHARKAQVNDEGQRICGPGSTDMFGSAYLKWWADTILRCDLEPSDETDSTIQVSFTKHRLMKYPPPKRLTVFWDRDTYHPFIEQVITASRPEGMREFRGLELGQLE